MQPGCFKAFQILERNSPNIGDAEVIRPAVVLHLTLGFVTHKNSWPTFPSFCKGHKMFRADHYTMGITELECKGK